ncbi:MAG: hypothetical protein WCC43_08775, partial [Pseudolabrys sp.]
ACATRAVATTPLPRRTRSLPLGLGHDGIDVSPSYSPKIAAWRDLRQDFARGAWRVDRVGG